MLALARLLLGPPKQPRNVHFPWPTFVVHPTRAYLEPNRIAFRVPVHLTKAEIRGYLEGIYDARVLAVNTYVRIPPRTLNGRRWRKIGPSFKKAFVKFEGTVPDSAKMLWRPADPGRDPALLKTADPRRRDYRAESKWRWWESRQQDWAPRHSQAWAEPLALLFRDPTRAVPRRGTEHVHRVQRTAPHMPQMHSAPNNTFVPRHLVPQSFASVNTALIRGRLGRSFDKADVAVPAGRQGGEMGLRFGTGSRRGESSTELNIPVAE